MADKLSNTLSDHIAMMLPKEDVFNGLTSTDATKALSAAAGKQLNDSKITGGSTGDTGVDISNIQVGWNSTQGWILEVTTKNGTKRVIKFA